jgi:hypothetical protein
MKVIRKRSLVKLGALPPDRRDFARSCHPRLSIQNRRGQPTANNVEQKRLGLLWNCRPNAVGLLRVNTKTVNLRTNVSHEHPCSGESCHLGCVLRDALESFGSQAPLLA